MLFCARETVRHWCEPLFSEVHICIDKVERTGRQTKLELLRVETLHADLGRHESENDQAMHSLLAVGASAGPGRIEWSPDSQFLLTEAFRVSWLFWGARGCAEMAWGLETR